MDNENNVTIVVMQRDMESGVLVKELCGYELERNAEFITNMFAEETETGFDIRMKLSTTADVSDWQFQAMYDYYDDEIYGGLISGISEVNNCFDPTWELCFHMPEDINAGQELVQKLVDMHAQEIAEVLTLIESKEDEYK